MVTSKGNIVLQLITGRSNVFLIMTPTGKAVLVDTSIKMMRQKLMQKLGSQGISRPDYLVLTHNHFDHSGNAAFVREQTGTQVIIHESEARELEQGVMKIPAGTLAVTRALVRLADTLEVDLAADPCPADITFKEQLELPGFEGVKVIHTPGHSKGSSSVIVDNEIAMVGDAMINAILFTVMTPFGDDVPLMKESWKKLYDTGCHTFLPSHGKAISRQVLEGYL